ncbi:hypothetical protein TrVE_jg9704 [Triparma verrucosa]|uniref:USP domain-containing protein n=1 Tax=Triparma verrucosa TaxID=1606542 RepID=A0A9W7KSA9_9STRA|nr:hypothetical protein TrVE_jg9704 [Triparma verrucosa]
MGLCQSLPTPNVASKGGGGKKRVVTSSTPPSAISTSRLHSRKPSSYSSNHLTSLNSMYTSTLLPSGLPQGVHGLPNLGNTCFFNTTLQLLLGIPALTDYFLAYDWKQELNPSNFQASKNNSLTKAYANLVKTVWSKSPSKSSINSACKSVHTALCSFNCTFKGYGQHDTSECLLCLLDGLHEDLNRVRTSKPYVEDVEIDSTIGSDKSQDVEMGLKAWEGYLLRNKSIIVDLFQGQLRSTLRCKTPGCDREVRRFETFMCLTLPLDKGGEMSLEGSFRLFEEPEVLEGENQWYCSKCKRHVDAEKCIEVWVLPPCLLLGLKRFTNGRRKINTLVSYPLSSFVPLNRPSPPHFYDLYSVSRHHGGTGAGGHYTALVRSRINDNWHSLNDSNACKEKGEVDRDGYVLAYCRMVGGGREHVRRQSVTMPHLWPAGHSKSKLFSPPPKKEGGEIT